MARNQDFINLGETLLKIIMDKKYSESNEELENLVKEAIGRIKENLTIRRLALMPLESGSYAVQYIHGEGKIGVLFKLSSQNPKDLENQKIKDYAFDCALHTAAFNPLFLNRDSVPASYLKDQEEIFTKQAENLGKPANVVAGIVQGKINKHLAEITLHNQPFVKDDKRTVAKVLDDLNKENGSKVSIASYLYYRVGEEL